MVFSIMIFSNGLLLFFAAFIAPFLFMIPSIIHIEKTNFFNAFGRCFTLGNGAYGDGLGTFMLFMLITVIFFFFLQNPIMVTTTDDYAIVMACISSIAYILFIFFMLCICFLSFSLCYYSSDEKKTAKGLYQKLDHFGKRNRTMENALDFE